MEREKLLAAEIFGYSFANYKDHLGIGNVRYERLMPEMVTTIERAIDEQWPASRLAKELKVSVDEAEGFVADFNRARQIIDADNPAESFRNAVRFSIQDAAREGVDNPESIEALVIQICFRAADLAFLLNMRGESLSRYSRHLRKEPDVEYYDGYFDEPE